MPGVSRLYERYATTHAGYSDVLHERLLASRDVLPHLDRHVGPVLDVGCGQGKLVDVLKSFGFDASGVDISPEQVAVAHKNSIESVVLGDYRQVLVSANWGAVIATDLVEHLDKADVLDLFESVRKSLTAGGVFIIRSPNASTPFGGYYQYSDFTHQTFLSPRSFTQLALHSGFSSVNTYPCPPMGRGLMATASKGLVAIAHAAMKVVLFAETDRRNLVMSLNFVGVARA